MWTWSLELVPEHRRETVDELGERAWTVLTAYTRGVVFVATVDAVLIGAALLIIGVPLALPLIVLTWLAAFFPIIGAVASGAASVLVTLVAIGPTEAVIVLGWIVVVQQVEGNVLYPVVVGPRLKLHPIVVLVSVALGGTIGRHRRRVPGRARSRPSAVRSSVTSASGATAANTPSRHGTASWWVTGACDLTKGSSPAVTRERDPTAPPVIVPEVVRNKALARGAGDWLDRLPELVDELAGRWRLRLGRVFDGATEALVLEATLPDGVPAVLKLSLPGIARDELTVLRLADGDGCAKLFHADEALDARGDRAARPVPVRAGAAGSPAPRDPRRRGRRGVAAGARRAGCRRAPRRRAGWPSSSPRRGSRPGGRARSGR